jgi:hypothetical protein
MSRSVILFALLITLLIPGCSSSLTPEPLKTSLPSPENPANEWSIKMVQSGGIVGLSRSIEISSTGKYKIMDERANKTITGELAASELSKLSKIVSNSKFASTAKLQPSGCADCFIYNLETQMNGKKFVDQADSVTLSASGLETLVIYLQGQMEKALK